MKRKAKALTNNKFHFCPEEATENISADADIVTANIFSVALGLKDKYTQERLFVCEILFLFSLS